LSTLVGSKDEDSYGGASNGDATFFRQTRLDFEFDFGLTGLELSHTLLEVCAVHRDKVKTLFILL
jgi:hypothetical protein